MNTSYQVNQNALRVASRIQAVLALIPRLVGPRQVWVSWMRENIEQELVSGLTHIACFHEANVAETIVSYPSIHRMCTRAIPHSSEA